MSGGKGGSQSTQVQIPQWLEDPSKRAIARGENIAQIGYTPYMGPDVAAFSPTQEAAFQNTNNAASAFGMAGSPGTGLPQPTNFGGVSGYSGYPVFDQAVGDWRAEMPGQAARYDSLFGGTGVGAPAVGAGLPGAAAPGTPQPFDPMRINDYANLSDVAAAIKAGGIL